MSIILTNRCLGGQSIALDRRARAAILYSVHPCAAFAPIPAAPAAGKPRRIPYYIYTRCGGHLSAQN